MLKLAISLFGGSCTAAVAMDDALSEQDEIHVIEYRIEGNTVIDTSRIEEILKPYTGRRVSSRELLELREQLTFLYVNSGFVNSGFVIPEQQVADGIVSLRAIEGVLEGMEITGLNRLQESFIRERIDHAARPFNILQLQQQLQLLLRDPRIERINSMLEPGIAPGRAWLRIDVTESRSWSMTLRLDNHRPPSIGSFEGRLRLEHFNVTGRADEFVYDLGVSEGLTDVALAYTYPVGAATRLGAGFQANNAVVIEEPFDRIDITSLTNDIEVHLDRVFIRDLNNILSGNVVLEKRHSETELLDVPFSFAPGVVDGVSDVAVVRVRGSWQRRSAEQVTGVELQVSQGLEELGATDNPGALPDSNFTTLLWQLHFVRSIPGEAQLHLRVAGQWAFDPLLPIEKFVLGGVDTVRGYRQNQLVRDNGWFASLEVQLPLSRRYGIDWVVFADHGRAWNEPSVRVPGDRTLSSVGIGLVWRGGRGWTGRLYWGHALQPVPDPGDHDLQDDGILFLVSWTL